MNWMRLDYTCGCGLYVHPDHPHRGGIHIADCPYGQAEALIEKHKNDPMRTYYEPIAQQIADELMYQLDDQLDVDNLVKDYALRITKAIRDTRAEGIDKAVGAAGRVMETVFSAYRSKTPEEFDAWVNAEVGAYR